MYGIMKAIAVTSRCALLRQGERLAAFGLKGCQASYILHVCRQPGLSQEELARRLHVNRSNVTRQVTRLEKAGFVDRVRGAEDRRVLTVHPTAQALAVLPEVRRVLHEYGQFLIAEFDESEKQILASLMERIAAKAEADAATIRGNNR